MPIDKCGRTIGAAEHHLGLFPQIFRHPESAGRNRQFTGKHQHIICHFRHFPEHGSNGLQGAIGNLRRIFPGAESVFVKVCRKHAEISVIQIRRLVPYGPVQCFDHIHRSEIGGEFHTQCHVLEHQTQQHFCLPFLCPCSIVQRAVTVIPGGRTGLPLNELNMIQSVFVQKRTQTSDPLRLTQFVGGVAVIREIIHTFPCPRFQCGIEPVPAGTAHGTAEDFRIRITFPDGCSCRFQKFTVFRAVDSMFPAPFAVGFVPDFIHADASFEMSGDCRNITVPCLPFLLRFDGRTAHRAVNHFRLTAVQRIAVAKTHPRDHSTLDQIIHNGIQPREIINALHGFCTHPAGLQTDVFHTDRSKFIVCLFRIKNIPVQFFKADPPKGFTDLICRKRRYFPRLLQKTIDDHFISYLLMLFFRHFQKNSIYMKRLQTAFQIFCIFFSIPQTSGRNNQNSIFPAIRIISGSGQDHLE